ncbi:MAG: MSHA biogenesis protein MshP [Alphaproteobacteria bacterium]|jgi:MSHA biogenesis protein MshP
MCNSANKQSGSMIVMALFVIVVIGLLAAALINIVSASSNSTLHQVYGLRANQAAKAGIEDLLSTSFPVDGSAVSCNTTTVSPASFSNVRGLNECSYAATCVTQTISFGNVDRMYFKFSSTGSCQIDTNVVSRTLSVDAIQEIAP